MPTPARRLLALSYLRVALIVVFVAVLPLTCFQRYASVESARAGCKRTNVLRGNQDAFLASAAAARRAEHNDATAAQYEALRVRLRAVPHTHGDSPEVDCSEANPLSPF